MGLKKQMKREMERLLDAWHDKYVKHQNEEIILDGDKLIEDAYANVAETDEPISDTLYWGLKAKFIEKLQHELDEQYAEAQICVQNPYAYNGLKQTDFY